jgi:anti-sigma regulatory factor (Ser/Thr protein kinase)
MSGSGTVLARATSDVDDQLVSADDLFAAMQLRCGGEIPGVIAAPELLEVVRKARRFVLKLSRGFSANLGDEVAKGWVDVEPRADGDAGCDIVLRSWQVSTAPPEDNAAIEGRKLVIQRHLAELTAELDADQSVRDASGSATDVLATVKAMTDGKGQPWTSFVTIEGDSHRQPLHWRLLDGARVRLGGSERHWRASLVPREVRGGEPSGFELCLAADEPLPAPPPAVAPTTGLHQATAEQRVVGQELAPVLRQPIARIIANAETIRTRLAGPLSEEYSGYAADIAAAGQHLLALLDDLSDLEVVEAEDFSTAPDRIDLADVARRAAGILGVRAREQDIAIDAPKLGETLPAIAEFRRALQILLNLLGNAIRYSPPGSQVWLRLEGEGARARVIVADQGPGLSDDQQARIFEKFERLGRSGEDGGSGLGLYISQRLARSMGGDLTVESAPGQGARFVLDLPADLLAAAPSSKPDASDPAEGGE